MIIYVKNSPDEDFVKSLNACRGKFKVVKSLLSGNAASTPKSGPDLSF
jgi:hypothetical protein